MKQKDKQAVIDVVRGDADISSVTLEQVQEFMRMFTDKITKVHSEAVKEHHVQND